MNASIPSLANPSVDTRSGRDDHYQVAIVGAGPTGLTLANLLAARGVRTLVVERGLNTVGEPRAVTIDDESLRTIQATGLIDTVLKSVVQGYGVHYFSWRHKEFARIEPSVMEHGFPKRNAFRQQVLVGQLRDGLARFPQATIWFGHELQRFQDDGSRVHLLLQHGEESKTISCDWLVACDGGRSPVREQLGIALTGSTYDEKWLIVDMLERTTAFRHTRTFCDPMRPAIRLPGPDGTLRYEFMLHEGEDHEAMLQEDNVRAWIHAREPADARLPITRKVVYAFHARVATRWKVGRVMLAGDAAHLTPPFAGQGMNSGVRDTTNLAWKLAAVVHGYLPATLLDTYEQERKPHAWSLIQMAVRIGAFMQPKSKLSAMLTQGALKVCSLYRPVRDYVLQLKFKPKPRFFSGFFVPGEAATASVPAGQLIPQPRVELRGGGQALLDDVLGPDFALLSKSSSDETHVVRELAEQGIVCKWICVLSKSDDFIHPPEATNGKDSAAPDLTVRDVEGVLHSILHTAGAQAVLLRPDHYVLAYLGLQAAVAPFSIRHLVDTFNPTASPKETTT